jgi:predicted MFS family arabinose efflux permease
MVAAAVVATTSGTLPVFLLGGLAVQVSLDLGLSGTQIGGLATIFFAVSALGSTPAGHLTERLGTYRSIALAATLSVLSLGGVGLAGRTLSSLAILIGLGGVANSIAQPAANLLLARGIPKGRRGLAFGIKQGAIPLSSFIGGAAVPVIGLTVGWRWAYGLAIIGPIAAAFLSPRLLDTPVRKAGGGQRPTSSARALVAIAVATGTGTAAATMLGTFLVAGAVVRGMSPSRAGLLLALGSSLGVAGRVLAGWRADFREGGHLRAVGMMMAIGAVGFGVLALAETDAMLLLGTVLAFGAGWGWNGLMVYAVVQSNPTAPAAATGITQTGLYLGGMAGPLMFGIASDRWGFASGWWMGAALLLLGMAFTTVGNRWLRDAPRAADVPSA